MQLLITKTKTLFLIKKFSWFSWLVWSVIYYYWLMIWKVLKFMNIWTWSFSLLISTTISMVSLFRNINQCRYARTGRKRKRWHMSCNSQFSIYIKKKKLVKDTYLKLMLNIINICMSDTMTYRFYLKKSELKSVTIFYAIFMIRKSMLCT